MLKAMLRTVAGTAFVMLLALPAAAGVKEGVEKWQAGDYKGAVIQWLPHAAKGDPDALFNMGQAYKLGRGVPMDAAKAEDFYRRAAEAGHAPAQTNLGILLAQRGDKAAAAELWKKAAAKRDARAQYMLGVLYFNGDTLPKNWPLAYAYMVRANNAGLPQAARALQTMNANIPKVDRDRGSQMADAAAFDGEHLADKGQVAPPPRRIENPIAIDKDGDAEPGRTATATATAPAQRPSMPAATVPVVARSISGSPRAVISPTPIPAPVARRDEPSAAPIARELWRVQIGAFSQESRATAAWNGR